LLKRFILGISDDPVAADATCPHLMGFDPLQIRHLSDGSRFLGNLRLPDRDVGRTSRKTIPPFCGAS